MKFKSFDKTSEYKTNTKNFIIIIGASIGFVSGVVGIGGGIFLSPILLLIKAGYAKHIATTASFLF